MAVRFGLIVGVASLLGGCLAHQGASVEASSVEVRDRSPSPFGSLHSDEEPADATNASSLRERLPLELVALPSSGPSTRYESGHRGHLENPEQVVDRHRPEFRRCFEHAAVTGQVSLAVEVDEQGSVSSASGRPLGHVPREVVHCIEQRAHTMQFEAPTGGRVAVPITVVYLTQ